MASFLKREIQAAVREEVSRVFADSTPTTTGARDTDTASAIAETRTSVTCDSQATSSTEDLTLSFSEFYALREEQRQEGFLPPKKKKKKTLGKSAVPPKDVDVAVKVGIASQVDGVFKSRRGKMHSITVKSNADKGEIIGKAIAKHSSFDQTFDGTIPYTLLFPDFSELNVVPGTKDPFVLSSYKQAISKDYKRLTFFLIPFDEFTNRCDDTDNSSIEECENEGGLTKWLSGREPKQTVVVGDSDEAHFEAVTNLEGGCFIQPLILVVYGASYKQRVEFSFWYI